MVQVFLVWILYEWWHAIRNHVYRYCYFPAAMDEPHCNSSLHYAPKRNSPVASIIWIGLLRLQTMLWDKYIYEKIVLAPAPIRQYCCLLRSHQSNSYVFSVFFDYISSTIEFKDDPSKFWDYLLTLYLYNDSQRLFMLTKQLATFQSRERVM